MRRRTSRNFLIGYFLLLILLSIVAVVPGGTVIAYILISRLSWAWGGYLVASSPTILLYSTTLIPLWLVLQTSRRPRYIAIALLIPVVVGICPGLLSRWEADAFGKRMSQADFTKRAAPRPNSIELIGDSESGLFKYAEHIGDQYAACNELCRRLLFNGEAQWVRMTRMADPYMNKRNGKIVSVTYRLEQHDNCPQVYPDGQKFEGAFGNRLLAGDCLMATRGDDAVPDATIKFIQRYSRQDYPSTPPENGPSHATIDSVKELEVTEQRDGAVAPVALHNETTVRTLALPFYIGAELNMQGGRNGPTIGRDRIVMKPIDLTDMMRSIFGYTLAPVTPPASPIDPNALAEHILSLPPDSGNFSTPQQQALDIVLKLLRKKPALDAAGVDLVRRIVADKRVTGGPLGPTMSDIFRFHRAELEPLVPVVIERLKVTVDQRVGHYQGSLDGAVAGYPAEVLLPHRADILGILEEQPDWPTAGLLSRIAELGDDPRDLITRRLHSKSNTVRQAAAIAICRASQDLWPSLEPIINQRLAELPKHEERLSDDEEPLMLALIRYGQKSRIDETVAGRNLFNKHRVEMRLAKYNNGFDKKECRAHF